VLRSLVILAATAPAALAAPSIDQDALPGLPAVKVQDLHYGDVLFHFYQEDYFDSLVRLAAYRDQGRLAAHARDAELLRGGLYLSLGQHREAREIFEQLLADPATPADVKSRAWFYVGKLLYASGEFEESDRALRQSAGTLAEEMEAERRLLIAQGLLYRGRYDQAIAELSNWQGPRYWLLYGQFNLGVALVRAGQPERGLALLDSVGTIETQWPELMALRDKANLAIGYARLQAGEPAAARAALERVRLSGPQSSKALLGAGWADAAARQFESALLPWQELQRRNLLDAAVQESYLAVPYAYAELGAMAQAVEHYERAIAAYDAERTRIGESIEAIRSGQLLAAAMEAPDDGRGGWFKQLSALPDSPESRYLYHLLAGNEFQEGLKNYRALDQMDRNLSGWADSLGAFTDMVETRRQAFARKLPAADARLATVDVGTSSRASSRRPSAGATSRRSRPRRSANSSRCWTRSTRSSPAQQLTRATTSHSKHGMGDGGGPRLRTREPKPAKRHAWRAACCCGSSTRPGASAAGRRAGRSATSTRRSTTPARARPPPAAPARARPSAMPHWPRESAPSRPGSTTCSPA